MVLASSVLIFISECLAFGEGVLKALASFLVYTDRDFEISFEVLTFLFLVIVTKRQLIVSVFSVLRLIYYYLRGDRYALRVY